MANAIINLNSPWSEMLQVRANYVQNSTTNTPSKQRSTKLGEHCFQLYYTWQARQELLRAYEYAKGVSDGKAGVAIC